MSDDWTELRDELDRLRARVAELEHEREVSAGEVPPAGPAAFSRRNWMKVAGAAAVGGAATVVAGSSRAAADDPNDLTLGSTKSTAGLTQGRYTGAGSGSAFVFQSLSNVPNGDAEYPSALAGWTGNTDQAAGVYGYSAVTGDFDAHGVVGLAENDLGAGVFGRSVGGRAGVSGQGGSYGVEASGDLAAARLAPSTFTPPTETTDFHEGGELYVRAVSDSGLAVELWYCAVGGTPGQWVRIAGPFQPPDFRPVSPTRVYDSRVPNPDPGRISGGENRTLDITQARDLTTGDALGGLVPTTARALAFNIAVVDTATAGFLSVAPSFASEFSAATINWFGTGQILNNGSVTSLGNDGQVKVFAGGAGSTHFVIDVTGYWE